MVGNLLVYVDNLQSIGASLKNAWQLARQIALGLQYLGIQDTLRKQRIDKGLWTGTVYKASDAEVVVTITVDKWNQVKSYISDLVSDTGWAPSLDALWTQPIPSSELDFKSLEQIQGYLFYLAMTFLFYFHI